MTACSRPCRRGGPQHDPDPVHRPRRHLIEEPSDFQIDAYEKLRFVPQVIPALLKLRDAGYQFVIVTNQDGLGSDSYPRASFDGPNELMLQIFESQGITFRDVLIDCSWPHDNAPTRKPGIGLMTAYLQDRSIDWARSGMVGDRITDLQFADNLNIRGFQLRTAQFGGEWDWPGIAHALADAPRTAVVQRNTKETKIRVELDLDCAGDARISTGLPFFDHMLEQIGKHGGFALDIQAEGDLHIDEHHTIEDTGLALGGRCARRWATSAASAATVSPCRWTRRWPALRWTSVAARTSCSRASSSANAWAICRPSWCRISSARCAMPAA